MKINFSAHARERMHERGLKSRDIRLTLLHPDRLEVDRTNPARFLAKKRYQQQAGRRRLLMIIYEVADSNIEVVTVISTSKIRKYL